MYSLKQRLHRNLLITVTLVMVILISMIHQGIKNLTQEYVTSRLQHDADSLVAALHQGVDGLWLLPHERMSTVYNRVQSGHFYLVLVGTQRLRSRSLFDIDIDLSDITPSSSHCYLVTVVASEQWMACLQKVVKKGREISIWVAEDISPLEDAQQKFMLFAIGSVIFAIVILLLVQYYILQRGFSPLEQVREAIKRLQRGVSDITLRQLPTEILPLVKEIDRLLMQLSNRVERSRNALGNLAHELKRPLQRYRTQLEMLTPEQRVEADAILQNINDIVERELKRARIVGVATPGRHTVIDEDLPELINVMRSIYPEKSFEAKYAKNLILPHDRDDILELLGNLLDNAGKYAKRNITIDIETMTKGWRITIDDDGEGVTQNALKTISDRGVRLDESIHGHGLGLSICKDIVESYHGEITFETGRLGGLGVVVYFPGVE